MCVCDSTYVKLKGELGRTDSLLSACWSWDQSQVVRLCSTFLSPLSHFTNPKGSVTFLLRPKRGTGVSPESTGFWWANLFHSLTSPSQPHWRFDVPSTPAFGGSKCLHGQLLSAPPPTWPVIIYLESPFVIWVLYYIALLLSTGSQESKSVTQCLTLSRDIVAIVYWMAGCLAGLASQVFRCMVGNKSV